MATSSAATSLRDGAVEEGWADGAATAGAAAAMAGVGGLTRIAGGDWIGV